MSAPGQVIAAAAIAVLEQCGGAEYEARLAAKVGVRRTLLARAMWAARDEGFVRLERGRWTLTDKATKVLAEGQKKIAAAAAKTEDPDP